jgi:hypothetical protein
MRVKPFVSFGDELLVKSFFASARLVPRHEKDSPALWIESERYAPHTIRCVEPQLLHIRVARAVQSINAGSPQSWPELLQKARQSC